MEDSTEMQESAKSIRKLGERLMSFDDSIQTGKALRKVAENFNSILKFCHCFSEMELSNFLEKIDLVLSRGPAKWDKNDLDEINRWVYFIMYESDICCNEDMFKRNDLLNMSNLVTKAEGTIHNKHDIDLNGSSVEYRVLKFYTRKANLVLLTSEGTIDESLKKSNAAIASLEALVKKSDDIRAGANISGLHEAFCKLHSEKKKEAESAYCSMMILGFMAVFPLLIEIFYTAMNLKDISEKWWVLVPSMAMIEFIFLYFFRISLLNHRSIKAQLLQLDLRKALCAFIKDYGDYSKELKANNSPALDKFESLIFSGLVSSEDKLPSTFDGLEHLASIAKSLASKGNGK